MYHYGYDNFMWHMRLSIIKDNKKIGEYFCWDVSDDFDLDELETLNASCQCCVDRFIEKHRDKPVSEKVLRELGLVEREEVQPLVSREC